MTGRDLIIYILSNNLEDEPVYKDGKFIGFIGIDEAAVKLNVGIPSIYALMSQGRLEHVATESRYLIAADCKDLGGSDA